MECFLRQAGHGLRKGLFLHCSLSSGKSLMKLMGHFEDEMTMVAMDLPGQGKSPMPDMERDYQMQCVEACIALIEAAGAPQDLVGHSFGATVALRLAQLRPDLVRSLVLFEPVYFGLLHDAGVAQFGGEASSHDALVSALESGDTLGAAEVFLRRWGLPGEWDVLPDVAKAAMAERIWVIPAQHAGILEDNDSRMRLGDLADVAIPTLVVIGGESPQIMQTMRDVLCRAMPDARGEVLEAAGHMVPITHDREAAALMQAFYAAI